MKKHIHPKSKEIKAICSCGNQIEVVSTICNNISLDVCSKCHPFYTGKQRVFNTSGRVEKFNKRFN